MKKIFLTLSIVGLYSLAYAAPSVEQAPDTKLFRGCYAQTITQYENSAGEYVRSVAGPRTSVPCGAGQLDGSTSTTYVHTLDPYADLWP